MQSRKTIGGISRRDFIKTSAALSLGAVAWQGNYAFAAGKEELKIGLIGCGKRGTNAVGQALTCSDTPVKLWAVADLFPDRIQSSLNLLNTGMKKNYDSEELPPLTDKMDVPPERQFVGFDAHQKLIDSGVDIVLLASPPGFRPKHLKAAVEAGKHVFMEKPVAVDPAGIRSVLESAELAKQKGLSIVAGTQRRHQAHYLDIMKRIKDGAVGDLVGGQFYWLSGGMMDYWHYYPKEGISDMEWQIRNWAWFVWLSGDHIVEQHLHNIDIMTWAFGNPVKCLSVGGRQVRTDPKWGNIYDHFTTDFEFEGGVRALSMCRQIAGATGRISEHIVGTKGVVDINNSTGKIEGQNPYTYEGENWNPYIREHTDLINSIVQNKPLNEGKRAAETTMTAIMGRMSAYTGREISWKWALNGSKLDLTPEKYEFGDYPVAPVAMPGQTKLI